MKFPDRGGYKKSDQIQMEDGAREGGKPRTYMKIRGNEFSKTVLKLICAFLCLNCFFFAMISVITVLICAVEYTRALGDPMVYGEKSMVTKFVASKAAAANVQVLAKIEIKLDEIPEGNGAPS